MNILRDRRGNVAMLLGLLAIPLFGLAGLAIDFGAQTENKSQFDGAADSASLLATTVASNLYLAGAQDPITPAQTAATQRFIAQAGPLWNTLADKVTVVVAQNGTVFTSDVKYTGVLQTSLSRVMGVGFLPVSGESSSTIAVKPFVDIQVLSDVSSSMTIAATQTDIAKMEVLTTTYVPPKPAPDNVGQKCAFACHWTSAPNSDYYALARRNGVQLRIDVLSAAVGNLISNIASQNTQTTFRIGLYTFSSAFNQIYALSTNITGANAAVSAIAPDVNFCSNACPESYFTNAMTSLNAITNPSGNGSSASTSQKFLFIISDGVVDDVVNGNRVIGPVNPADCAALKAKGVTISTLYTYYLPLPTNPFYQQYVAPYNAAETAPPSKIQLALQACASSPSLALRADNAADIDRALQQMLATVIQTTSHFTK